MRSVLLSMPGARYLVLWPSVRKPFCSRGNGRGLHSVTSILNRLVFNEGTAVLGFVYSSVGGKYETAQFQTPNSQRLRAVRETSFEEKNQGSFYIVIF